MLSTQYFKSSHFSQQSRVSIFKRRREISCKYTITVQDLVPRLFKHYPHPGTTKTIIHYLQIMNSGKCCPFDYGSEEENMKRYNQITPPEYDLSKVTAPTAIFYSYYDTMVNYKDAQWLVSQLNNTVLAYSVPKKNFAHLSFMWEPNINSLVYDKVLDVLFKDW